MTDPLLLRPGKLRFDDLRSISREARPLALDPTCWSGVDAAAATVSTILSGDHAVYGVNTGFGSLARTRIPRDQVAELQHRLVLSHAAGTGPLLSDATVRQIIALKLNSLGQGHSGARRELLEALLALANAGVYPCIPAKGSVGASGDLAPLAHLAGALIGAGEVRVGNKHLAAAKGLKQAGLDPLTLQAKEGLALVNGTQVSTALLVEGLLAAESLFAAALVAGALSVDAALGSDAPFDARLHALTGHPGRSVVARAIWNLLQGSAIRQSHEDCSRVQDPYSLRCQPQVMGACLDQLRHVAEIAVREANSVSDNPLVFPDSGEVLSGGNFHAESVAMAADAAALAIAEIGAISERRIALLTDAHMSDLPAFLVAEPGINSGFMAAQVTAAALASENKALAHPTSVDSLPTSANQEDHVSMATYGAYRLGQMVDNAAAIVAIELLAAAQGVELRAPLETSDKLKEAISAIRGRARFLDRDRQIAPDIAAIKDLIFCGRFSELIAGRLVGDDR